MRTKHRVLRMDQSASSNSSAHKTLRQTHILKSNRLAEQRGDFFVPESGNAAADASHIEEKLRMLLRKCDERSNVRLDGLHTTLHSGDSVALATKTNATTHYGSELFPSSKRRTASVHSFQVAAKNEHLIGLQFRYHVRCKVRTLNFIVRSHIVHEGTKNSWKSRGKLRFCDHVLMAIIAKSEGTFHQEHQGSHIQSNGNNNLKHGLHHLLLQS